VRTGIFTSMKQMSIYTDGSAIGNNNVDKNTPAGYGLVIIEGDPGPNHDQGKIHYFEHGPVVTDPKSPLYAGATKGSNNTAELTAIWRALDCIITMSSDGSWYTISEATEWTIYSDSQYAIGVVSLGWKAKENIQLVNNVKQRLTDAIEAAAKSKYGRSTIAFQHVRAHSKNKWNDEADSLAKKGAGGKGLYGGDGNDHSRMAH
jgi:ribonuclease HI